MGAFLGAHNGNFSDFDMRFLEFQDSGSVWGRDGCNSWFGKAVQSHSGSSGPLPEKVRKESLRPSEQRRRGKIPQRVTKLRSPGPLTEVMALVAPYCAIPRDYLSDTPLLRAMGFLVSQHGQLGAIPSPPF